MKFAIVALVVAMVLAVNVNASYDGDGQPLCNTEAALAKGIFRNTWDPTRYWQCVKLNEPGVSVRCPDQTGFSGSAQKCVPWSEWDWVEPVDPNSA